MTSPSSQPLVLAARPVSGPFAGVDPFLFVAYHQDQYPAGQDTLGPDPALLRGRRIGMDFSGQDGWSMYHGDIVPGFPAHPHRGFETVTIVRQGLVDHADSLGAAARYGQGDVQWLTTGRGVQHAEMFPLVNPQGDNTLDLFQIWLNLPARHKMAEPAFSMFWAETIPQVTQRDADGRSSRVTVIAGDYRPVDSGAAVLAVAHALPPPPDSWASQPEADVAIWIVQLSSGARLSLPAASAQANRTLYLTTGRGLEVDGQRFDGRVMISVRADRVAPLHNASDAPMEVLVLQGRPIGEPVAARGPFVMNHEAELLQAIRDYQRTAFGGWPWSSPAPTHGTQGRFARHPDGRLEHPSA